MTTKTLSGPALKIINDYLHLPFSEQEVNCPYLNNRHTNIRAGLRALVGKGSTEDIIEEAMIISLQEKIDLKKLDNEQLKKFLIGSGLGVDCSGFFYHVMDAELRARGLGPIRRYLKFPYIKNPLRRLLAIFRPAEHAGARTLGHSLNAVEIKLKNILPGDFILMLETGLKHNFNHLLLIHQIDYAEDAPQVIHYTHSFAWSSEGQYEHGVRPGKIEITDINKGLLEQAWTEKEQTGENNETFRHAQLARELSLKRLKALA